MRPRSFISLVLVAALSVACTGPTDLESEPEPVATTSPTPSESPSATFPIVSCRGLHVPINKEVNTGLDRERGLLDFSYYVAKLQEDRNVTIRYRDDPWCRRNRETLQLIQHVGAGKEVLGCLQLPEEPAQGMTRVELWFHDRHDTSGFGSTLLVRRDIPSTAGIASSTLETWIAGPTKEEVSVGAMPTAPKGTELLGIDIDGSTVIVDLSSEFEYTGLGTTYEGSVVEALAGTLTQFDDVARGRLKIEGEFKDYYMGHGFIIDEERPLTRPGKKRYRIAQIC